MRRVWALLLVVVLLFAGVAAVRAASWSPFAPAPLPVRAWAPTEAEDPATWQTLANETLVIEGGVFVVELQGFRRMTSSALHHFEVRVVRVGGEDARVDVRGGVLDGRPVERVAREEGALVASFSLMPVADEMSVAAEVDLRAWREAPVGFLEAEPRHVRLVAQLERRLPET